MSYIANEYESMGPVSRDKVEQWLQSSPVGTYIIRDSLTRTGISLSVKYNETTVRHFKVKEEYCIWYIQQNSNFKSLQNLIDHYRSTGLINNPFILKLQKSNDRVDAWSTDESSLTDSHLIGKGNYSKVYKATWNKTMDVAVKKISKNHKDPSVIRAIMKEIATLKQLRHPHLVKFLGVCENTKSVLIITELLAKGDLKAYLKKYGKKVPVLTLISFSRQVASGMVYLEECQYIHRDLAARNILVDDDDVVKIADFGLARFTKEQSRTSISALPYKWTAPENLSKAKMSIKSDVWSYGMLLYEIFSYCLKEPYDGMRFIDVIEHIYQRKILDRPECCPTEIYEIMKMCWEYKPVDRPSFSQIYPDLDGIQNEFTHNRSIIEDEMKSPKLDEMDHTGSYAELVSSSDIPTQSNFQRVKKGLAALSKSMSRKKKKKKSTEKEQINSTAPEVPPERPSEPTINSRRREAQFREDNSLLRRRNAHVASTFRDHNKALINELENHNRNRSNSVSAARHRRQNSKKIINATLV